MKTFIAITAIALCWFTPLTLALAVGDAGAVYAPRASSRVSVAPLDADQILAGEVAVCHDWDKAYQMSTTCSAR